MKSTDLCKMMSQDFFIFRIHIDVGRIVPLGFGHYL